MALLQDKPPVTAEAMDTAAPVGAVTNTESETMEDDHPGGTKVTKKCQVKSSKKEHPPPISDSHGEPPAPTLVMKAGQWHPVSPKRQRLPPTLL